MLLLRYFVKCNVTLQPSVGVPIGEAAYESAVYQQVVRLLANLVRPPSEGAEVGV